MNKRSKEDPSPSSPNDQDWSSSFTLLPGKDEEGFQTFRMFDHDIRTLVEDGEPWFVVQDLSKMFGIHAKTIPKRIENNPEDFEGRVRLGDVTYPRKNLPGFENLNQSLLLVNEPGVYVIMGGLNASRMKNPAAQEMVRQFKRAFPELMKMFRKCELVHISQIESHVSQITGKASPIVGDCFEIADMMHKTFGIDKSIASVHLLNGYRPDLIKAGHSGNIEPILQLLPPPKVKEDEAYLTATTIGRILKISNRTVNQLLHDWEYHIPNKRFGSDGTVKPSGWKPTALGFQHGDWKMNSDGHYGGKMYVGIQWRWKESILQVFEKKLGLNLDPQQVTFKNFEFSGVEA